MTGDSRHDRLYRAEAIVLHGIDFKEADRILTVYSREHGKFSVIAKAIRKPTSRLGYGLDHLSRVKLTLAHGRTLDTVTNVELLDAHSGFAGRIEAYAYASHLAELVNRLTQERQENRQVYELLAGGLKAISDEVEPFHVARYFELSLFALLGYRIELYHCVNCGRELTATANTLSAALGGFLCSNCQEAEPAGILLSVNAQKYLRLLDRGGLEQIIRRDLSLELRDELELAMLRVAFLHAERELTSLSVLRALEEPNAGSGRFGF